jgi:hypothetical protein
MLTGQLVQRLRLFYRSKTIFVGLLPLSDEPSEWLHFCLINNKLYIINNQNIWEHETQNIESNINSLAFKILIFAYLMNNTQIHTNNLLNS